MRYNALSIDLETLGTAPGSIITQIGLCAFNDFGGELPPGHNIFVDPQSCIDREMTATWDTLRWWLQQSDDARNVLATTPGTDIKSALQLVRQYMDAHMTEHFTVWGYAANFDVTLLEAAFFLCSLPVPWTYRQVRCARTLLAVTKGVDKPVSAREHVAAEDARAQAATVIECINKLRVVGP